jgi:hypothetical protein
MLRLCNENPMQNEVWPYNLGNTDLETDAPYILQ